MISQHYQGDIDWTPEFEAFCRRELDDAIALGFAVSKQLRALAETLNIDECLDEFLSDAASNIIACANHKALRWHHAEDVFRVAVVTGDRDAVTRASGYWADHFLGAGNDF
jgi:hypothetical protein